MSCGMDVSGLRGSLDELLEDHELSHEAAGHRAMMDYVIGVFENLPPGESASAWVSQWRSEWDWLNRWVNLRNELDDADGADRPPSFEQMIAMKAVELE